MDAAIAETGAQQASASVPGETILRDRRFQWAVGFIVVFNAAFVLFLLIKPFDFNTVSLIDNVGEFVGPLVVVPLCFLGVRTALRPPAGTSHARRMQAIGAMLIGGDVLAFIGGQAVVAVESWVLKIQIPVPSIADVLFLAGYPLAFVGVLLLPSRSIQASQRTRALLDGMMVIAAAFAFLWFFDLGATLVEGGASLLTRVVASAYPIGDLILIVCLVMLGARGHDPALRRALPVFVLALLSIVWVDSLYAYQHLHNSYVTGGLEDVLWPFGYSLMALAAWLVIASKPENEEREEGVLERAEHAGRVPMWRSLIPYALVPCVLGLAGYTLIRDTPLDIEDGVVTAAGVLVVITLLRQILAILENERLRSQEQEYLREVGRVIQAAGAVEAGTFQPGSLQVIAARQDALGQLGRVFQRMGREVKAREQRLQQEVQQLRIEIDHGKREREVKQITETDYFQDLQRKAAEIRRQKAGGG